MTENMERFAKSQKSVKTERAFATLFRKIGSDDFLGYGVAELEDFLASLKPDSPRMIKSDCSVLNRYAEWLREEGAADTGAFCRALAMVDREAVWKKAKPAAARKFLSHDEYLDVLRDIQRYEEYNGLYYKALFACIYEGVYNDDLSVIKNLRASDIRDGLGSRCAVSLRDDAGGTRDFDIPAYLGRDLKELGGMQEVTRASSKGAVTHPLKGPHPDSCFKLEDRKNAGETDLSYRFSYYRRLRKIASAYVGFKIPPQQLFASGVMHRIAEGLSLRGVSVEEAFGGGSRSRETAGVISGELERCGYAITVPNFREMVRGHLEVWE